MKKKKTLFRCDRKPQ